jgi:molybdopterin/thiamine biosynthesis adenylyltransferase
MIGADAPVRRQMTESSWSYDDAFSRNFGLISRGEQAKIRSARIAIAGMGGVGGNHLVALARLGFSRFRIADPDTFAVANFNRQLGATLSTLGMNKAAAMARVARDINPEVEIDVIEEPVAPRNVDDFLAGCDVFVDGLDFFAIDARRLVFRTAQQRGIWSITAGPIGLSSAWLVFDPQGMTFDRYFDFHDNQDPVDQIIAFAIGLTPKATHRSYMDLSGVSFEEGVGPSASPACHLACSVAATEATKIVLSRGSIRPAPCYAQFDLYLNRYKAGRLRLGNRDPRQWIKRKLFKRFFIKAGVIPQSSR